MNISYNWLRELVETDFSAAELAARLTNVGLAVDTVHSIEARDGAAEDFILEIDLTSNRPDCLSHLGVAREVAVIGNSRLKVTIRGATSNNDAARVENRELDLCPRYAAQEVRGVKIEQSPAWLLRRLEAIGQRGINNVADITNYVLHELGQPLHAFDLHRLKDERIIVRRASENEKITTLDEVERVLDLKMLIIADAEKAVAIAGVMGGAFSGVSDETTNVLIESAYFTSAQVRRTAHKLNLHTEASNHFERGTDPQGVSVALRRAVDMICEIAGGTAAETAADIYPNPIKHASVRLRFPRINALIGLNVDAREARAILTALGFAESETHQHNDDETSFIAPSWRVDIEREEDLIEEVIRHTGIEKVPSRLPLASIGGEYLRGETQRRAARRALINAGYDEAINFSFIDPAADADFAALPTLLPTLSPSLNQDETAQDAIDLSNPIIENLTRMRSSLIPGLLGAVRHNINHGTRSLRLFELGNVFAADKNVVDDVKQRRPLERESLGLITTGNLTEANRFGATREVDFYDLKGALEAAIESMKLSALEFAPADVWHLQQGQSAHILLAGKIIGSVGRVAGRIETGMKLRQNVFVAELDFDALLEAEHTTARYRPLARFPFVTRDTSIIVNRHTTFALMRNALLDARIEICQDVRFVDVYEGANLPDNTRSLTLRAIYADETRTLRDEEVDDAHKRLVQILIDRFDAQPRQ